MHVPSESAKEAASIAMLHGEASAEIPVAGLAFSTAIWVNATIRLMRSFQAPYIRLWCPQLGADPEFS